MSVFADAYSRYLSNHFQYITTTETFRKYFKDWTVMLTDPNFMSATLLETKDDFPKYPYFLNVFVRTDSVNLVKIYQSTLDMVDILVDTMVGSSVLEKRVLYDSIPSSLESFLAEINFQFAYISSLEDLYDVHSIIRTFISETQYRNFFSDLYSPLFYSSTQSEGDSAGLEDGSSLYQYMLYTSLYNVLISFHNIYSQSLRYLDNINDTGSKRDRADYRMVLDAYGGDSEAGIPIEDGGFKAFAANYNSQMSIDLAELVSKTVYGFQNTSLEMLQSLVNVISAKLSDVSSGLYDSFYDFYVPLTSLYPTSFLVNNLTQQLNAYAAIDIMSQIHDDYSILDETIVNSQIQQETTDYETFMEKSKPSKLKNYLFLCFLYKFWPIKFLNVLQLTIKEYTETIIKTLNDDTITKFEYQSDFRWFISNGINYTALKSFLDTTLLPTASIVTYGSGTLAEFTFTTGSANVVCSNLASFNAVSTHEYIYPDGDSRDIALHIVDKNVGTLTLIAEREYTGSVTAVGVNAYMYSLSTNYFSEVCINKQIGEFACLLYYLYVLDLYTESTNYDDFVEDLAEEIFTHLRNNGHINYQFDWYEFHNIIDVYFKTYFRWKLTDQSKRCVLADYTNGLYRFTYNSNVVYCSNVNSYNLISDGDLIFSEQDDISLAGEVASHSIIGTNMMLILTSPYSGTSTTTGQYESAYYYNSTDVPLFNELTQNFVNKLMPNILTNSTADPDYDINIIVYTLETLQSYFTTFSRSPSFSRCMHRFNENLMVSTLTRELIYSVLSDFIE